MSPADLATLSLIDPDQGVCPNGHACRLDDRLGDRRCDECAYRGLALICWNITPEAINAAESVGAAPATVANARLFEAERQVERN